KHPRQASGYRTVRLGRARATRVCLLVTDRRDQRHGSLRARALRQRALSSVRVLSYDNGPAAGRDPLLLTRRHYDRRARIARRAERRIPDGVPADAVRSYADGARRGPVLGIGRLRRLSPAESPRLVLADGGQRAR